MIPLTLLSAQKIRDLLTTGDALQQAVNDLASACSVSIPPLVSTQVTLSSANSDIADMNLQLTYPRICIYSNSVKNTQVEKFRSFSGTVMAIIEIFTSGDLATDADQWIHFYVEGVSQILRQNIGDWGNGLFFSGMYDVQIQPPKAGGFGFVESAKVSCGVSVSLN